MDTASLMRADLWTYLSENCLVKTDRASMAHGLEVRVPLRELFNGAWREVAEDALRRAETLALFLDGKRVRALWDAACHGWGSRRLAYTLVVLLLWLERHPLET